MLYDKAVWQKYAGRDKTKAANWAPMPKPPVLVTVVPTAQEKAAIVALHHAAGRATAGSSPTSTPSAWKEGKSGFGTRDTPGAVVGTEWNTRRHLAAPRVHAARGHELGRSAALDVHHDEDAEVYLNGVLAASATGFTTQYEPLPLNADARAALKPGKNLIAVHCHQTDRRPVHRRRPRAGEGTSSRSSGIVRP